MHNAQLHFADASCIMLRWDVGGSRKRVRALSGPKHGIAQVTNEVTSPLGNNGALPPTRAAAITAEIRRMIEDGALHPGEHLRQVDFSERFGVSTTPIREAFTTLAKDGLVRQDAHRGVVVFDPSVAELEEIFEMRLLLEPLAASLAAIQLTDKDYAELARLNKQMRSKAVRDPDGCLRINVSFHDLIYGAARRPRLLAVITPMRQACSAYLRMLVGPYEKPYRLQVANEHEVITAALLRRDPKAASAAMREHLANNERHLEEVVQARK